MIKKLIGVTVFVVAFTGTAIAGSYDAYIQAFKRAMADCSMKYGMTYKLPDGNGSKVRGQLAVSKDYYYDSSNVRFALLNDKWLLVADHVNKFISISSMANIRKEIGKNAKPDISSYLVNDVLFESRLNVKVEKDSRDTIVLDISIPGNNAIEKLHVTFLKSRQALLSYSAVFNYPLSRFLDEEVGDDEADMPIRIEMEATSIIYPAPRALFDDNRIISSGGKKATLKRYREYHSLLPNSK